ncbi:MAG: ArdC-like ssDNA-binding domain-containing protein [Phycisphaerae bacterium]
MKYDNQNNTTQLRKSIDESLERLAHAVDDQRASDTFRQYLDTLARFHRYSWKNCLLILAQNPEATQVAGFTTWKKFDRCVRSGEKAIRIFAPCPVMDEAGEEIERVFFKTACVFDVSQTEGKDIPTFVVPEIEITADELLERLERVANQRGIRLEYRDLRPGLYGQSRGGQILLAESVSSGQKAKSLAHEICHESLHINDESIGRQTAELEAEAVAYVVCRHFGLDVELRASRYITKWGGDGKKVAESFERISRTARDVIEDLDAIGEKNAKAPQIPTTPLPYVINGYQ